MKRLDKEDIIFAIEMTFCVAIIVGCFILLVIDVFQ